MPPRPKSKRNTSLPVVVKHDKQTATRPVMLLVLGPHRSGTSLTARMLECLGVENSKNQLPPQPDNPTGFFEDSDVYAFDESVFLPKLQRRWDSVSPTDWSVLSKTDRSRLGLQALEIIRRNYSLRNPISVLKEPRINNTLPFWLSLLEHAGFDVRFVCVVRDPVSTARSLDKRNNFSVAHGGMIYLSAWLSVLPHLQERQVAFVQFDEIFATPGKVLAKVADKLGLPLPPDFDQRVHAFTSAHLDASLRHSTLPREDVMLEPDLPLLVTELYRVLLEAAQSQNIRKTAKFLAYAERQIESLGPLLADYDAKQTRLASLQEESQAAQAECARLQSQRTDSSHQSHAAFTAERHALVQERELIRSERDTLAQERSNLIAERDALATRHQQLATALEDLQGQHSSLSTHNSSLIAERDDLATRHSLLTTALEQLQGQHNSLVPELESLRNETAARQAAQNELQAKLATAEQRIAEARSALEKTEAGAKDTAEENELLLRQLHQAQEELEKCLLENRELKQQHDHLAASHASLVTTYDQLSLQMEHRLEELSRIALVVVNLESSLQTARVADDKRHQEIAALLSRTHSLEDEKQALLKAAQARTEEMAALTRRLKSAEDLQSKAHRNLGPGGCAVGNISLSCINNTPPHRHAEFLLTDVYARSATSAALTFRLVEHHGNYGFCLLWDSKEAAPCKNWQPNGFEGAKSYLLCVPSNRSGKRLLGHLSHDEISLLLSCLAACERTLRGLLADSNSDGRDAGTLARWLRSTRALQAALVHHPSWLQ